MNPSLLSCSGLFSFPSPPSVPPFCGVEEREEKSHPRAINLRDVDRVEGEEAHRGGAPAAKDTGPAKREAEQFRQVDDLAVHEERKGFVPAFDSKNQIWSQSVHSESEHRGKRESAGAGGGQRGRVRHLQAIRQGTRSPSIPSLLVLSSDPRSLRVHSLLRPTGRRKRTRMRGRPRSCSRVYSL